MDPYALKAKLDVNPAVKTRLERVFKAKKVREDAKQEAKKKAAQEAAEAAAKKAAAKKCKAEERAKVEEAVRAEREVANMACSAFMNVTRVTDPIVANDYLSQCAMSLDTAVALYFDNQLRSIGS